MDVTSIFAMVEMGRSSTTTEKALILANPPNKGATQVTAMAKVLNLPELLEGILLHLPMEDLLFRLPLVNKAFKSAIDTSPTLRRILFVEPDYSLPINYFPFCTNKDLWYKTENEGWGWGLVFRELEHSEYDDGPVQGVCKYRVFQPPARKIEVSLSIESYSKAEEELGMSIVIDHAEDFRFDDVFKMVADHNSWLRTTGFFEIRVGFCVLESTVAGPLPQGTFRRYTLHQCRFC